MRISSAAVHPVVLLGVVDHYNRSCKNTRKRAVGMLLGTVDARGHAEVLNSFAVPFEEDERNPTVFFFDHDYVENMSGMFRKVSARERVIGWYSTGPKICAADLDINEIVGGFCGSIPPVYVICQVESDELGIPIDAYVSIEDETVAAGSTGTKRFVFEHVPADIGALEAEEVGTEHLLRDVKDSSVSTLGNELRTKLESLKSLKMRLTGIRAYLEDVAEGRMPMQNAIMYQLEDILSRLLRIEGDKEWLQAMAVHTNDQMLVVYIASMARGVLALHDLISNKIELADSERKMEAALASIPSLGPNGVESGSVS